jgi:hypothetical protein
MSMVVFSNGRADYGKGADGRDVLRIHFDDALDDASAPLGRHELPAGARLETNGAVAHSFGRGVTMVEVVSLAALQSRFPDEEIIKESAASGSCTSLIDEHGIDTCVSVSCTGTCGRKCFLFFCWCSCR